MKIKKSLLVKLHVYAGLFTSIYLLAFGISSLILNHDIKVEQNSVSHSWKAQSDFDKNLPDKELATVIRDDLELMGWVPWWKYQRDSVTFSFEVTHFGKTYQIAAELTSGDLKIQEVPKGFLAVLHSLHFLNGNIPNAPLLIRSWAVYQWLSLAVMLISLVLGLWLWWKFSFRQWHLYVFGGMFLGSIFLMFILT